MKQRALSSVLHRALFMAFAAAPASCAAVVTGNDAGTDGRPDDVREGGVEVIERPDEGGTCYDPMTGRTLRVGESNGAQCPCTCTPNGLLCASCPPPGCPTPDGRWLAVGESYYDGCNTCTCSGTQGLTCTARACVDGGVDASRDAPNGDADPVCAPRATRSPNCPIEVQVVYPCGIPGGRDLPLTNERCNSLCAPGAMWLQGMGGFCRLGPSTPTGDAVQCGFCGVGRLTEGLSVEASLQNTESVGQWFATSAKIEAIAAIAFERIAEDLEASGAPAELTRKARTSAQEERGHAAVMEHFARLEGASVEATSAISFPSRSLAELAIENAAEGCVRETLGAVVMAWQAAHAPDAAMRSALARVAEEEARHAEWSWELDAWARKVLSRDVVLAMDAARDAARKSLVQSLTTQDPSTALVRGAGMPPAVAVQAMVSALEAELWNHNV